MNNDRRKAIADIVSSVEKLSGDVQSLRDQLESQTNDEQEYFDNMPESLQGGEKGQNAEQAVDALTEALDKLQEATDALDEAASTATDAANS